MIYARLNLCHVFDFCPNRIYVYDTNVWRSVYWLHAWLICFLLSLHNFSRTFHFKTISHVLPFNQIPQFWHVYLFLPNPSHVLTNTVSSIFFSHSNIRLKQTLKPKQKNGGCLLSSPSLIDQEGYKGRFSCVFEAYKNVCDRV